mmetsp:Transcript_4184/g.9076  ORF Transcript_4184/g.9076 Transcript_4184/m.9076 type:complete len:242 (-) Transcript_4184:137-862(-)
MRAVATGAQMVRLRKEKTYLWAWRNTRAAEQQSATAQDRMRAAACEQPHQTSHARTRAAAHARAHAPCLFEHARAVPSILMRVNTVRTRAKEQERELSCASMLPGLRVTCACGRAVGSSSFASAHSRTREPCRVHARLRGPSRCAVPVRSNYCARSCAYPLVQLERRAVVSAGADARDARLRAFGLLDLSVELGHRLGALGRLLPAVERGGVRLDELEHGAPPLLKQLQMLLRRLTRRLQL